jgi:hypothetical protein
MMVMQDLSFYQVLGGLTAVLVVVGTVTQFPGAVALVVIVGLAIALIVTATKVPILGGIVRSVGGLVAYIAGLAAVVGTIAFVAEHLHH